MRRFPQTRYIPTGAIKVADKHSDAIAYIYSDKRGRPCAIVYYGKQTKAVGHHGYRDEAARAVGVKGYFEGRQAHGKRQVECKAERLAPNKLIVGDILVASWGYDQTNVDFYQVIAVKGQYVTIRKIGAASEDTSDMTGRCAPQSDLFIGEPMRKLVQWGDHVTIDDVRSARKWNTSRVAGVPVGPSQYFSSYH